MKLERYQLKTSDNIKVFEFVSEGPKGRIEKIIQLSETNLKGFYNLAFGDKNPETGVLDDLAISNNGDMDKILATVVAAVLAFTERNPDAYVYEQEALLQGPEFIGWGFQNIMRRLLAAFNYLERLKMTWKNLKKIKIISGLL